MLLLDYAYEKLIWDFFARLTVNYKPRNSNYFVLQLIRFNILFKWMQEYAVNSEAGGGATQVPKYGE